jgi:glucosamine-6-phosphate deaminase
MPKPRLSWDQMLKVPVDKLNEYSFVPVRVIEHTDEMFRYLARFTADLIKQHAAGGKPLVIAWPCGPKRHFPILADICNRERISWRNTFNIQVDEWLDWKCRKLPASHPFNLQSYLRRELLNKVEPELRPREEQMLWLDPLRIGGADDKLDEIGGIDVVFGGFGFTGHIAYNEPPTSRWFEISNEEFLTSRTRIVPTNDETFIMHAHRSTGGNTRIIPPMAVTLGMKDWLGAKMARLVSDGGAWKQTVFRVLCMAEPTVKCPASFIQLHPNAEVIVDGKTAAPPPDIFSN